MTPTNCLSVLSGLQSVFNETHISSDVKVKPAVSGCRKTTSFRQRSRLGLHEAEAFDRNLRPELMKCSSTFGISWNQLQGGTRLCIVGLSQELSLWGLHLYAGWWFQPL